MTDDAKKGTYGGAALPSLATFRLSRLHARANAHAARILKKSADISLSEWRIMVMVETHGRITPSEITRITEFDKGLVSRTAKKMVEKGLLRQVPSESDHRSHAIEFTDKGLEVLERARPHMRARQNMFREALTPDELEMLFRIFDKLDAALEKKAKT